MSEVTKALALLGLHIPFTSDQIRKQYYRCALAYHPDKGGDTREMQMLAAARDLLEDLVSREPPPTPGPSAKERADAIMHGSEFLRALRETSTTSRHRSSAMQLWRCIHDAAHSPIMSELLLFGAQCVEMLARNVSDPSWFECGYKYLGFQGYDVDGRRIINYGDEEYNALLQFWALAQPAMQSALNRLRSTWPTLMDLWKSPKSGEHVERLADIVEIIMGAARAESWFQSIWNTDQYRGRLPALFSLLTT